MTKEERIQEALAGMTDDQRQLREKAIMEGYKDEVCSECGTVFLAFHHFIRCESDTCPMKLRDSEGHAPSFLEMIKDGVPSTQ